MSGVPANGFIFSREGKKRISRNDHLFLYSHDQQRVKGGTCRDTGGESVRLSVCVCVPHKMLLIIVFFLTR